MTKRCSRRGCGLPAGHRARHTDGTLPTVRLSAFANTERKRDKKNPGHNLRGRHRVHSSSKRDDWETPPELFAALDAEFHFTIDVAASRTNHLVDWYFTKKDDALRLDWGRHVCWMNPPYGHEIRAWMAKALSASRSGALVVCLVPARTDTRWWHESAELASERRFLKGRLRFRINGQPIGDRRKGGATSPFPSAVVIFRP